MFHGPGGLGTNVVSEGFKGFDERQEQRKAGLACFIWNNGKVGKDLGGSGGLPGRKGRRLDDGIEGRKELDG